MRNFERRLRKIEEIVGVEKKKSYLFVHLRYPDEKLESDYCRKDDFVGKVIIYVDGGKPYGEIYDSFSEEGKKILLEHGYEIIDSVEKE